MSFKERNWEDEREREGEKNWKSDSNDDTIVISDRAATLSRDLHSKPGRTPKTLSFSLSRSLPLERNVEESHSCETLVAAEPPEEVVRQKHAHARTVDEAVLTDPELLLEASKPFLKYLRQ